MHTQPNATEEAYQFKKYEDEIDSMYVLIDLIKNEKRMKAYLNQKEYNNTAKYNQSLYKKVENE